MYISLERYANHVSEGRITSHKEKKTFKLPYILFSALVLTRQLFPSYYFLCTGAFLYVAYNFLLISNKICGWGGGEAEGAVQ
jgi:hypothetical protein